MEKYQILSQAIEYYYQLASEGTVKKARKGESGNFIFGPDHPKVTDNKGHYPLTSEKQAHSALSYANRQTESPSWFSGTVQEFLNAVVRAVHKEYPSIEISEAAKHPGKG